MAKVLTIKQERFCQKYLECGNASEAYRFAYEPKRCTDKSIWENASKLLSNAKVAPRLAELKSQAAEVCNLERADALRMLSEAVLADVTDYVSPDGIIRTTDILKMPKSKRRLIEKIESTKYGCKITLISKSGALDRLAKMCGWDAEDKARERELSQQREALAVAIASMPDDRRKVLADIASDCFKTAPDVL